MLQGKESPLVDDGAAMAVFYFEFCAWINVVLVEYIGPGAAPVHGVC